MAQKKLIGDVVNDGLFKLLGVHVCTGRQFTMQLGTGLLYVDGKLLQVQTDIRSFKFSMDGKLLVLLNGAPRYAQNKFDVFDTVTGNHLVTMDLGNEDVREYCFACDSKHVYAWTKTGKLYTLSVATGTRTSIICPSMGERDIKWLEHLGGNRLFFVRDDAEAYIMDIKTPTWIDTKCIYRGTIQAGSASVESNRIALFTLSTYACNLMIFEGDNGLVLHSVEIDVETEGRLFFTRDGQSLFTNSCCHGYLWDVRYGSEILKVDRGRLMAVDDNYIYVGNHANTRLRKWEYWDTRHAAYGFVRASGAGRYDGDKMILKGVLQTLGITSNPSEII